MLMCIDSMPAVDGFCDLYADGFCGGSATVAVTVCGTGSATGSVKELLSALSNEG